MPELPEVENVKIGLNELVTGETIEKVDVLWSNIIESPEVPKFESQLIGQTIENVQRRGKFLLFYFTDYVLISHLRMEGKYQLHDAKENTRSKHTHVIFHLRSGKELHYHDVRKFGRMSLVKKGAEFAHKSLAKLGPEPTAEDFLLVEMKTFLTRRKKAIKGVLLDQQLVVGVGNIYADEILFAAKIHPETPANELTAEQENRLHEETIRILKEATEKGGTTIRSYQNAFADAGTFQQELKIYGRTNEACVNCETAIEKIKVAGRGTHFCPTCQVLKG